jgi:hypothetical protein
MKSPGVIPRFGQVPAEEAKQSSINRRLKTVRERARRRGSIAIDAAVEYFVSLLRDSRASRDHRLRAAENLCDRFGFPRQSAVEVQPEAFSGSKYLVVREFAPPATFNPEPPAAEMQSVHTEAEHGGDA